MEQSFHKSMTLGYKGGFPFAKPIVKCEEITKEISKEMKYTSLVASPSSANLTADISIISQPQILKFTGYQKSPYCFDGDIPIVLLYFCEDDTIKIIEEKNKHRLLLVKRGKHCQWLTAKHYHWSDLNIGIDITIQGLQFHLCDCDKSTAAFLVSEGIDLKTPIHNNTESSQTPISTPLPNYKKPSKLKQFLDKDGQVLRFFCLATEQCVGIAQTDIKACVLLYYLADDTLEIREVDHPSNGVHPFCVRLSRQKVAKSMRKYQGFFPCATQEPSADDVNRWYTPLDLQLSLQINIYGRYLQLIDCDEFTRKYYIAEYNIVLGKPFQLPPVAQNIMKQIIPNNNTIKPR